MEKNEIIKIEIDEQGSLLVFPRNIDNSLFEFIYRAGKGVYWKDDIKCIFMKIGREWTYTREFKNIIDAVKSELGISLIIGREVKWQNVDLAIELGIKSIFNASEHTKLQIQDYIQVSQHGDHVIIMTNDWEIYDLIDDLLTELDLGVDFLTDTEIDGANRYTIHLLPEVSINRVTSAMNAIDIQTLQQIWSLNN